MDSLFNIKNLRCSYDKNYQEGKSKVVLEIERLAVPRGKIVFIVGESGIGKSTILETLGMMNDTIVPSDDTEFTFSSDSSECINLKSLWTQRGDTSLSNFRLKHYSFIFQSTNLMRNFTAYENVAFTRMLQGYGKFHCFQRTRQVLEELGMEHITPERKVHELSGGQQQRLAFARAILPDFTVLFGDEPTGNLDAENAVRVMSILSNKLKSMQGASAIIVSHDMHLAVSFADVIIKIRKCVRPHQSENGEDIIYGKIDEHCVFTHNDAEWHSAVWSNGAEEYSASEFENFLRKK